MKLALSHMLDHSNASASSLARTETNPRTALTLTRSPRLACTRWKAAGPNGPCCVADDRPAGHALRAMQFAGPLVRRSLSAVGGVLRWAGRSRGSVRVLCDCCSDCVLGAPASTSKQCQSNPRRIARLTGLVIVACSSLAGGTVFAQDVSITFDSRGLTFPGVEISGTDGWVPITGAVVQSDRDVRDYFLRFDSDDSDVHRLDLLGPNTFVNTDQTLFSRDFNGDGLLDAGFFSAPGFPEGLFLRGEGSDVSPFFPAPLIPEPATGAVVALGAVVLVGARRRRRLQAPAAPSTRATVQA